MANQKGKRVKHIPQRTCVGCRQILPKRELIRVVRTPEGRIQVDLNGKSAGRGAYLHNKRSCWEAGINSSLERALKMHIIEEDRDLLTSFMNSLPNEEDSEENHTK